MIAAYFSAISKLLTPPDQTTATPIDDGWLGDGDPGQILLPRFFPVQ